MTTFLEEAFFFPSLSPTPTQTLAPNFPGLTYSRKPFRAQGVALHFNEELSPGMRDYRPSRASWGAYGCPQKQAGELIAVVLVVEWGEDEVTLIPSCSQLRFMPCKENLSETMAVGSQRTHASA